jgi:hypothetical protein
MQTPNILNALKSGKETTKVDSEGKRVDGDKGFTHIQQRRKDITESQVRRDANGEKRDMSGTD